MNQWAGAIKPPSMGAQGRKTLKNPKTAEVGRTEKNGKKSKNKRILKNS